MVWNFEISAVFHCCANAVSVNKAMYKQKLFS